MPALATALTVADMAVGAVGAADDRPGAGGGLAGAAFAVQLDDHVGTQGGVLLLAADPPVQLGLRSWAGREGARVEGRNTGSKLGVAGWPVRWRAAAMARCQMASGLGVSMPSPWRVKALRSDGQVVPSSLAAALTLPSCSASWTVRSAWARSVRKRLGCQPTPSRARSAPCRLGEQYPDCYTYAVSMAWVGWAG